MTTSMILQHQPRLSLIRVKMTLIAGIATSILIVEAGQFFIGA